METKLCATKKPKGQKGNEKITLKNTMKTQPYKMYSMQQFLKRPS